MAISVLKQIDVAETATTFVYEAKYRGNDVKDQAVGIAMNEVEVCLRVQHLVEMTVERTDRIRRRMRDAERDQKILVGPSHPFHTRRRKRREMNEKGERTNETNVVKVETVRQRERNVVRNELEKRSELTNIVRFVAEEVMTRRQATIAAMMAIRVGTSVVDREIQVTMNRLTGDRGAMTIPAQVRRIVTIVVGADVVRKRRKGPIAG